MSAAAIVLRRKKLIRGFVERGACSPDQAIAFGELGMRRSWVFNQMVSGGVVIQVSDDRFYLDQRAAEAFMAAKRQRMLIGTGLQLLVFVVFLLVSALRR